MAAVPLKAFARTRLVGEIGERHRICSLASEERSMARGFNPGTLQRAVQDFLSLERICAADNQADGATCLHSVVSAMHALCAQVRLAEHAGMPIDQIAAIVAPARTMQSCSPFVARLQTWPRGYPGDFETITYLMEQKNRVASIGVAYYIEEYALGCPVAQQHRNKVQRQSELIARTLARGLASSNATTVLLLACGGAQDVQMAAPVVALADCRIVLNDMDPEAIALARKNVAEVANRCTFIEGNVLTKLSALCAEGRYDLILAGGLFDYLTDRQVEFLLRNAKRRLLNDGGRFFFTNMAEGNPYRVWLEYFADWHLIERSERDIVCIAEAAGFLGSQVSVSRDSSGLTLLTTISA